MTITLTIEINPTQPRKLFFLDTSGVAVTKAAQYIKDAVRKLK